MKKILFIFGSRPEAIKMGLVVNVFKQNGVSFETRVAVTAQHRQMLEQVLEVFQIESDFDLDLMVGNQTLESLTGKVLNGISGICDDYRLDLVFVPGDTTTTFAASLAAFYHKIPVGHVEPVLRTGNKYSHSPEEINCRMTSIIATYHFPPTEQAAQILLHEGVNKGNFEITGNTVIDALRSVSAKLDTEHSKYETFFSNEYDIYFSTKKTILYSRPHK